MLFLRVCVFVCVFKAIEEKEGDVELFLEAARGNEAIEFLSQTERDRHVDGYREDEWRCNKFFIYSLRGISLS